ncbi:MAG: biopolymer transporter ExbD [Candidatus Eisenbacteria bacterium]
MRGRNRRGARRARWASRLRGHTGLSLTSLMDILTCLLFFVLKSFVAGGEATVPPPGLTLPNSTAERQQTTSLVVAVQRDAIFVSGERVASLDEVLGDDDPMIRPLAQRATAAREQMDALARANGREPKASHLVTIQGDGELEFRVLRKVMYTLDQSGFPDIALAVIKKA